MSRQRSPNWCVTLFEVPTEDAFKALVEPHCECYSAQVERAPTTGKLHVQCFLQFGEKVGLRTVQKLFGGKPHCDVARSPKDAYDYCQKEETRAGWSVAKGQPRVSGTRTDIASAAKLAINEGIRAVHAQMPEVAVRFHSGLVKHVCMMDPGKRYFPVSVKVYWGKAGVGKTRSVPDGAGRIRLDPNGMVWYDDCVDREVAWLDDFYGNCRVSEFLQLTDVYSFPMRVMGGFYPRKYTTLYITSNVHPREWYSTVPEDVREAILRRLDITEVTGPRSRSVLPETSDHFSPLGKPSSASQEQEYLNSNGYVAPTSDHFSRPGDVRHLFKSPPEGNRVKSSNALPSSPPYRSSSPPTPRPPPPLPPGC